MAQTMVNFRMDTELKNNMDALCKELGLSMTTAFTIFATKMTREQRIPFEVSVDPFYSPENIAHLERITSGIDNGTSRLTAHDLVEG